ncbi:MAG: hypothetical protein PHI12_07565 [Dehalococcoidales bacterium]|nr:hypothetical protein [Dehalococcoidales bacterium]
MELTAKNIKQIEKLISSGMAVEVVIVPEHKEDAGAGVMVTVPETLMINGRPPVEGEIRFNPVLLDTERDCVVEVRAHQPGEDPVAVAVVKVPKGKYVAGLITKESR